MTDVDISAANKALSQAKIRLMDTPDTVFLTTVCFSLKSYWNDAIDTARTDGMRIEFSPSFFMKLPQEEQMFVLLHETLHAAFKHADRLGDRDPTMWNVAADYVINAMLVNRGFQMPIGGLHDPKYLNWDTETVYKDLVENQQKSKADYPDFEMDLTDNPVGQPEQGKDQQDPPQNDGKPCKTGKASFTETMDDILIRAQLQAKMANEDPGLIPGALKFYIDSLLSPRLPWTTILRKLMNSTSKTDYSYRRPNRRFFPEHIIPSVSSHGLDDIAIAVDTSGSVTDEDFKQYVSEAYSILKGLKPKRVQFIQFDYGIQSIDVIRSAADLKRLDFQGRGGTCVREVVEWAKENKPNALLFFSDGYFDFYNVDPESPGMPIFWIIDGRDSFHPPYGKVIYVNP